MSMVFPDNGHFGIRLPSSLSSIPFLDHLFLPTSHQNTSSLASLCIPLLDVVVLLLVRSNRTDYTY